MLNTLKNKRAKHLLRRISILLGSSYIIISSTCNPIYSKSTISNNPKEVVDQVWQMVYRDYLNANGKYNVENWKTLRMKLLSKNYSDNKEAYDAIRGMLSSLEDPYTRFLDPREFKELRIDTSGELSGVGIQLSIDKVTKHLIVVSPIEGSPASRAGVQPKDIIKFINNKSTKGYAIEQAVKLIRGKKGTKVRLGLSRNGNLINIELIRDRIELKSVLSQVNINSEGTQIGYIRLKQFNANASKEMKQAIQKLESKKVKGYVLDLRGNPGGLLEASVDVARQWLNKGTIVVTKTKRGITNSRKATGNALTKSPLVVLVNEGSASASEILSGAIQDNKRGILIGNKTFGKGLVQSVRRLVDGSGMTLTIAKYLTPKGKDIHNNGIYPDIEIDMPAEEKLNLSILDLGSSKDTQYVVAETTLLKAIDMSNQKTSFKP